MFKSKLKLILIGGIGLLSIAGAVIAATTAISAPAIVRLAHLSPDAAAVDFYVNNVKVEPALSFGQVGPAVAVADGQALIIARVAGTAPDSAPLIWAYVTLYPGATHIVALANTMEYLQVTTHVVPSGGLIGSHGRVHVIHALPRGPRVDIELADGRIALNDLGYLEQPSAYFDLPTGQHRILAITETDPRVLVFDIPALTLQEGTVYTIVIAGSPTGTPPVQAILVATP